MPGQYHNIHAACAAHEASLRGQYIGTFLMLPLDNETLVLCKGNHGWETRGPSRQRLTDSLVAQLMAFNEGRWAFM